MRIGKCASCTVVSIVILLICAQSATAATFPSLLTGGFNMAGGYSNTPGLENYFVGTTATGPQMDRRAFFVFGIPSLSDPVISAKLKLQLPAVPFPDETGFTPGYFSDDASETVTLFDAPPAPFLSSPKTTPEAITAWTDLGSGSVWGSAVVTAAMAGTDIEFTLAPGAVGAINGTQPSGGFFTIGAAVTTLDGSSADEIVFAFSDLGSPHMAGLKPRLELTLLPEPSALGLILLSVGLAQSRRRR